MRSRRGVLFVLAALVVLLTMGVLGFRSLVSERWQSMIVAADAIEERLAQADPSRPSLYGGTQAGNAFDDYAAALALLRPADDDRWQAIQDARRAQDQDLARRQRDEYLADRQDALSSIRSGAHRATARRVIDWRQGFAVPVPNLLQTRALANLCVLRAEQELDAGRQEEAVHWLLDAAQMGRDHAVGPVAIEQMIGIAIVTIATNEALVTRNLIDRLGGASLSTLAGGLRILDEGWPVDRRANEGELLAFVRTMQQPNRSGAFGPTGLAFWRGWRYGFSMDLMAAASFHARLRDSDELAGLVRWADRWTAMRRQSATQAQSHNPLTRICAANLSGIERNLRATKARLRMLRMAVDYRLDSGCTALPDPFGGVLTYEVDGDTLRLTSRGADGTPGKFEGLEVSLAASLTERK